MWDWVLGIAAALVVVIAWAILVKAYRETPHITVSFGDEESNPFEEYEQLKKNLDGKRHEDQ